MADRAAHAGRARGMAAGLLFALLAGCATGAPRAPTPDTLATVDAGVQSTLAVVAIRKTVEAYQTTPRVTSTGRTAVPMAKSAQPVKAATPSPAAVVAASLSPAPSLTNARVTPAIGDSAEDVDRLLVGSGPVARCEREGGDGPGAPRRALYVAGTGEVLAVEYAQGRVVAAAWHADGRELANGAWTCAGS